MKAITNNVRLTNEKIFKAEVKQYAYANSSSKKGKYSSLIDMKRQLFSEFIVYSEEELDLLHTYIKSKSTRSDRAISSYLPVWAAISIYIFSAYLSPLDVILDVTIKAILSMIVYIILLLISTKLSDDGIERLNFCNLVLELIEKIEEIRERTFVDSLAEEYSRRLTMSETDEEDNKDNEDNLSEET